MGQAERRTGSPRVAKRSSRERRVPPVIPAIDDPKLVSFSGSDSRGVVTLDGKAFDVGPGAAVLTRTGSSHSLKQTGTEDLVILINYEQTE